MSILDPDYSENVLPSDVEERLGLRSKYRIVKKTYYDDDIHRVRYNFLVQHKRRMWGFGPKLWYTAVLNKETMRLEWAHNPSSHTLICSRIEQARERIDDFIEQELHKKVIYEIVE